MKHLLFANCLLLSLFLAACQGESRGATEQVPTESVDAPGAKGELPPKLEGTVVSTHDSGGYTYVEFDTGEATYWAAGPQSVVAVGDRVEVQTNMLMGDFYSETLDRTFEEIFFTMGFGEHIKSQGFHGDSVPKPATGDDPHASMLPQGHPSLGSESTIEVEDGSIPRAESGYTVDELWAKQDELSGKEVVVRGRVTKFMAGILDRNWVRLADGTGQGESATITVTTDQYVKIGDLVLVRGQLAQDADFGAGYVYEVLIEGAFLTVE